MTTSDRPAAETRVIAAHTTLSPAARQKIFFYLGTLIFLLAFGDPAGGLINIPITFFLKNKLHLTAQELADFRLIAAIPVYLSFVFGFVRDLWSPFGMKDRGFMLLFGMSTAGLYVCFAFMPVSTVTLLAASMLLTTSFLFVASAQNGLASTIGQQHAISGQISAVWNSFTSLPNIVALLLGGSLSSLLESQNAEQAARILFLVGAAIMVLVAAYAGLRPKSLFGNLREERTAAVGGPAKDIRRLLRHWPIYPALLIWTLWSFAPGSETPLQYYLQDTLHAGDTQWGQWNAIVEASYIPTFILFGLLCRRLPLKTLLFWGTIAAVPQMVPLMLVHSATAALVAAIAMGLMGGVATAAYLDLIIRSCPPGLQGTMLMTSTALSVIASRFGDVLGTFLYQEFGGFTVCVVGITVIYALIFPALMLVPKDLVVTADGQKLHVASAAEG